ncbi:hypothetical protein ACNKW1_02360 [Thauera sp. WH-2]|uniref:hypothetical protein n=1 Tax=Thauera sp. WH-2 TaxID=3401574 RepID=UPI003AAF08CF
MEAIAPEISLWLAVVAQLIEDALDFQRLGPDRHGYREEAHLELNRPGPMLQRLCGLAGVDRDTVLAAYQRRLKGYAVAKSPTFGPETARLGLLR